MKLIIEHTDLEVLYYALGCLSPMNEAHKPLAILLARLEVQRERYFIPLNDDSWPAYSATPRHGTSRVGDDWLTRSVWHQRNGTACSHGIDPADCNRSHAQLKLDFDDHKLDGPELAKPLSELLSPPEAELVDQLRALLGEEPQWTIETAGDRVSAATVCYRYRTASGERNHRCLSVDHGKPDEMLLHALRQALSAARADHVQEG